MKVTFQNAKTRKNITVDSNDILILEKYDRSDKAEVFLAGQAKKDPLRVVAPKEFILADTLDELASIVGFIPAKFAKGMVRWDELLSSSYAQPTCPLDMVLINPNRVLTSRDVSGETDYEFNPESYKKDDYGRTRYMIAVYSAGVRVIFNDSSPDEMNYTETIVAEVSFCDANEKIEACKNKTPKPRLRAVQNKNPCP